MRFAEATSGLLTAGVLSDDHRAVVWAVSTSPGPVSIDSLSKTLAGRPGSAEQARPRLDAVLSDLRRSGLVDIVGGGDARTDTAGSRPGTMSKPVVAVTERGTRLAAELFLN